MPEFKGASTEDHSDVDEREGFDDNLPSVRIDHVCQLQETINYLKKKFAFNLGIKSYYAR